VGRGLPTGCGFGVPHSQEYALNFHVKKNGFAKKTYLWSENGTDGLIDHLWAEFINCAEVEMKI